MIDCPLAYQLDFNRGTTFSPQTYPPFLQSLPLHPCPNNRKKREGERETESYERLPCKIEEKKRQIIRPFSPYPNQSIFETVIKFVKKKKKHRDGLKHEHETFFFFFFSFRSQFLIHFLKSFIHQIILSNHHPNCSFHPITNLPHHHILRKDVFFLVSILSKRGKPSATRKMLDGASLFCRNCLGGKEALSLYGINHIPLAIKIRCRICRSEWISASTNCISSLHPCGPVGYQLQHHAAEKEGQTDSQRSPSPLE